VAVIAMAFPTPIALGINPGVLMYQQVVVFKKLYPVIFACDMPTSV